MKSICLLLLAVAGVPFAALAQSDRALAPVTDAQATVAPLQYRSVFANYSAAPDYPSPDKLWIQANQEVAGGAGHGHHGPKVEAEKAPAAAPKPAPDTVPDTAPAADPHKGHKMHNMKGQ